MNPRQRPVFADVLRRRKVRRRRLVAAGLAAVGVGLALLLLLSDVA